MQWSKYNLTRNRSDIVNDLAEDITATRYGFGENDWNLTDILIEPSQLRYMAMQILAGEDGKGKKLITGPLAGDDGEKFMFRLRVVTRQACDETADGKYINGWSAGNRCKGEQTPENTIFPEWDEPPQQGDVIKIKRGYLPRLSPQQRNAMKARGQDPIVWVRKKVDADGCITVDFEQAAQLLRKNGKRLVFPEFRRPDAAMEDLHKRGQGPKPRRILQWHFEEVPQDYSTPKKRGRKAAGSAADSAEAGDEVN